MIPTPRARRAAPWAMADWYGAMLAEGLKEAGPNKMEQFARGGLVD